MEHDKNFQKFKKNQKFVETGVIKILIITPLILDPGAGKKTKIQKDSKISEKLQIFLKIADIKILKNIPLYLEANRQYSPRGGYLPLEAGET